MTLREVFRFGFPIVALLFLVACGSNDDNSSAGTGGSSASGGTAGTGGGGAGGSGGTGATGSGATGGSGGSGGVPPTGDAWYVSTAGDNTDGKSWATAWNELDQIDWAGLAPGDRIEVEGGTYTTRLEPDAGGTASGRITLERSTEAGHDGKVTFDFTGTSVPDYWAGMIAIKQPFLTIDGKDWNQLEMITDSSCLLVIDNNEDADYFELRNVRLEGHANKDNGGAALCIFSGSVALDHVWFGTQVGAEDHIKLVTSSHSALTVEHSVFSPWISIDGSHSDLIEQCWPGCEAGDLVFKRNLVWDSGPGGGNLVFTLDPHWANVDVSYNVFLDTYSVFQFSSQGAQRISNNVFYNVNGTFGGDGAWEAVNNIFVGPTEQHQHHLGNDSEVFAVGHGYLRVFLRWRHQRGGRSHVRRPNERSWS